MGNFSVECTCGTIKCTVLYFIYMADISLIQDETLLFLADMPHISCIHTLNQWLNIISRPTSVLFAMVVRRNYSYLLFKIWEEFLVFDIKSVLEICISYLLFGWNTSLCFIHYSSQKKCTFLFPIQNSRRNYGV